MKAGNLQHRLIVFARAPVTGRVKTRLARAIGSRAAAAVQRQLIERTLDSARRSRFSMIEMWCTPDKHHPFFTECGKKHGLHLHSQNGNDLGDRMFHAFSRSASPAILIGCDCPTITPTYLEQAAACLDAGYDAVLGPTEDGGYGVIGLKKPSQTPFCGIAWGTARVAEQTRRVMATHNWRWHELAMLWDIDWPSDLQRALSGAALLRAIPE